MNVPSTHRCYALAATEENILVKGLLELPTDQIRKRTQKNYTGTKTLLQILVDDDDDDVTHRKLVATESDPWAS